MIYYIKYKIVKNLHINKYKKKNYKDRNNSKTNLTVLLINFYSLMILNILNKNLHN